MLATNGDGKAELTGRLVKLRRPRGSTEDALSPPAGRRAAGVRPARRARPRRRRGRDPRGHGPRDRHRRGPPPGRRAQGLPARRHAGRARARGARGGPAPGLDHGARPAAAARATRRRGAARGGVRARPDRPPLGAARRSRRGWSIADPETVELAIEALGKLGDKRRDAARSSSFLARPDRRRCAARRAVALWRLADSTALDAAARAPRRSRSRACAGACSTRSRRSCRPDGRSCCGRRSHLDDPTWLVARLRGAHARPPEVTARAPPTCSRRFGDPEAPVVVNAIRALQSIADTTCARVRPRRSRTMLGHEHPYVRVTAATALGDRRSSWRRRRPTPAPRGAIRSGPISATPTPRRAAPPPARCSRARRRRRWPWCGRCSTDSSVYARVAVLAGLSALPPQNAATALLSRGSTGAPAVRAHDRRRRCSASVKATAAVPTLRAGLADTSMLFVASCAGALAAIGDTASVPALVRAPTPRAPATPTPTPASRSATRCARWRARPTPTASSARTRRTTPRPPSTRPTSRRRPRRAARSCTPRAGDIEWAFYRRARRRRR